MRQISSCGFTFGSAGCGGAPSEVSNREGQRGRERKGEKREGEREGERRRTGETEDDCERRDKTMTQTAHAEIGGAERERERETIAMREREHPLA